jgi:hypothetical protein
MWDLVWVLVPQSQRINFTNNEKSVKWESLLREKNVKWESRAPRVGVGVPREAA